MKYKTPDGLHGRQTKKGRFICLSRGYTRAVNSFRDGAWLTSQLYAIPAFGANTLLRRVPNWHTKRTAFKIFADRQARSDGGIGIEVPPGSSFGGLIRGQIPENGSLEAESYINRTVSVLTPIVCMYICVFIT